MTNHPVRESTGSARFGEDEKGVQSHPLLPGPATANRSNRSLGPQRRGEATGEPEPTQLPRDLRRPHAGMESTSPGNCSGLAQSAIPPSWRSASALHPIRVNREPALRAGTLARAGAGRCPPGMRRQT